MIRFTKQNDIWCTCYLVLHWYNCMTDAQQLYFYVCQYLTPDLRLFDPVIHQVFRLLPPSDILPSYSAAWGWQQHFIW